MLKKGFRGFKGLSWRVFIVTVLCLLIPLVTSFFITSYFSQRYLGDSARDSLLNVATEKRNQIELALSDLENQAQSIAMQPSIVDSLSEATSNSANPSEANLQKITKNLEDNYKLANGLSTWKPIH